MTEASGNERHRATVDLQAVSREMNDDRSRLHGLLAAADASALRRRSNGTRWTNEQLLFHMVFGYLVVRALLPLVWVVSRLPAPVGQAFATSLNSARRPFHLVNYWGSCAGARVFDHTRLGWLCDRTITALQSRLQRETETSLRRGMPFPTNWDPCFRPYMTLGEIYRYPNEHFEHHRRQLTLGIP